MGSLGLCREHQGAPGVIIRTGGANSPAVVEGMGQSTADTPQKAGLWRCLQLTCLLSPDVVQSRGARKSRPHLPLCPPGRPWPPGGEKAWPRPTHHPDPPLLLQQNFSLSGLTPSLGSKSSSSSWGNCGVIHLAEAQFLGPESSHRQT